MGCLLLLARLALYRPHRSIQGVQKLMDRFDELVQLYLDNKAKEFSKREVELTGQAFFDVALSVFITKKDW